MKWRLTFWPRDWSGPLSEPPMLPPMSRARMSCRRRGRCISEGDSAISILLASIGHHSLSHFQKPMQLADAGGVAHFAQRLGFDLANALAGDPKLAADLFERARIAVA